MIDVSTGKKLDGCWLVLTASRWPAFHRRRLTRRLESRAFRAGLPGPELIVWLSAPLDLLRTRLEARGRTIDLEQIVTPDDLPVLESYLEEWLGDAGARVLKLDVSGREAEELVPLILERF